MKPGTSEKGRQAEDRAIEYLQARGLKLLQRNFLTRRGEIDLVMQDKSTTVFIEVRARKNSNMLHPLETIDQHKVRKIILASKQYLQKNRNAKNDYYRFDVVTLTGPVDDANIEWIKDAFNA